MPERAFIDALALLVASTGRFDFPDRFLHALRVIAGTDLCSAFSVSEDGSLRYLFATGRHPAIPGFAEIASLAYARNYWHRDHITRQALVHTGSGGLHVVRQAWNGIADPEYRRACYERAGIVERLTLYSAGRPALFASAYRTRASGSSNTSEIEALERFAPILIAAVAKHDALTENAGSALHPPSDQVMRRLLECGRALSAREAAVAAAMLVGKTQKEISQESGVALNSVVTYRRRAYRKLGVSDRRGLATFFETIGTVAG